MLPKFSLFERELRSHVPFSSSCEVCVRARGLKKARHGTEVHQNEVQLDQFWHGSLRFLILVHSKSFAIGCVSGDGPREAIVAGMSQWLMHFGLANKDCLFTCDAEGYMRTLWQQLLQDFPSFQGTIEQFAAGRHAPVAERGVRALRETASGILLQMQDNFVALRNNRKAFSLLFGHACAVHNRYNVMSGSMLSPLQRLRGNQHKPRQAYIFGGTVLVAPPPSKAGAVTGRFAYGSYLGPVLGKASHWASIQVKPGVVEILQSPPIKMLLPVRYDLELLGMLAKRAGGIVHRPPLLPDIDRVDDELTVLPLSLTEDGNPPKEWLLEHGRTRRCLACERGMFHGVKHSVTCRKRYRAWLEEQREAQPEAPGRQGGEEPSEAVPAPIGVEDEDPVVDVELPDDFVDVLPSVEDYLPSESEGRPRPASETQGAEDEGYGVGEVPTGDAPMEVDSCWSVASYETLEAVPLELAENFAVGVECRQSVFSSIEDDGWTELKMRDRVVYLQKPSFVRDDATDKSLDPAKANAGMAKEIRALDSLRVGDAITRQEADAYCREHGIRILSTRWVSVAKKDGETKEDIVRARVVARDYASGSPTAAELGISSPTSSNEAFRSFLVFVSATESEIVLADVSTAFLFALIVSPECVMLPPNIRFSDNTRVFLKLRKALYGLRSASLAWYKHLSELVKEMGLHASDTEKSVFSGEYEFKGKKVWMLLLAYVDDLMIACKDKEAALNLVERLGRSVKIKVTGILSRDKKIDFPGRVIQKIEYGLLLGLPEGYFSSVYESYGIKKGTTTPPDLRKILDDALEKPECQKPLTAEAASRYRSAVGKISWGGQTRIDLTYFISVLSRGQSTPLVVHETCLRAFLRYLMSVDHLKQLMGAEECSGRVEAFVDSNWAPERNNDRRSLSGCVILVDGFPIKAFTRQQSSVAMSSAEAELVAITEGAKEAVGVVSLIQHIWGAFRTCQEPPAIFSDSQAAINIGSMHGLLRRVRHIDLRVCWTQAAIQDRLISLSWVRGVGNPADLFTKALAKPHVHYEKLGITEHLPREALLITDADCDQIVLSTLLGRIVSTSALERYARQLDEVNPVRNRVNSGMKLAAETLRSLKVICITEEENGLCEEIIALTRNFVVSMIEQGVRVLVWSSTPCTGGCLWQYTHRGKPGHDARLRKLWGIQRKLWKNLCLLVSPVEGVADELQPYFAVEWPKTCQYWSWKDVQKMLESRERPVLTSLVDGCSVGMVGADGLLVHKRWRVDSDYPPLASTLDSLRCTKDHIHSNNFDLRETQHYPVSMCEKVLSSLK